ncbi:MAG: hypothetical protein HFI10_11250 [Lachnospiraceae bacterium]|jgi:hypothetical protein|nr:hypothetical protein [Lachnospiraceae bacterium]
MFWKNKKGTFGYIEKQRRWEIIKTLLMFGISIALYGAGYLATKSNKNLLTLAAVLGCLPASRSAVGMIMFLKAKGCSKELREVIGDGAKGLSERYDLYLTSYAKNFQISHLVMKGKSLIGITEQEGFDEGACYQHVKTLLSQNGFRDITVKIFRERGKYLERLKSLRESEMEDNGEFNEKVLELMENLSL